MAEPKRRKSDLPFGSQFSPAQIRLPDLLRLTQEYEGDEKRLTQAVSDEFFPKKADPIELAKNTVRSMRAYGILSHDARLTDFGKDLVSKRRAEPDVYEALARHILINLHGAELVNTILDMQRLGVEVTLESLREELEKRGIHMPSGGTHASSMKGWLQKAGVFRTDSDYAVDEMRYRQLAGLSPTEIAALSGFSAPLRAFLLALARMSPDGRPVAANKVADHARVIYGVRFPEKSLPQTLRPLVKAGFITLTKTTVGRGAKPHLVQPTEKARADIVAPLLKHISSAAGYPSAALWLQPLATTLVELNSNDTQTKGLALERLAMYFCWLLDLQFRGWRRRGNETSGAEVDVLAEAARLVFTRWQIQCKNTARVTLDHVAREVGVATRLKPHVIMIVTTGRVGDDAKDFARDIMKGTHLNIAFLDRDDLKRIATDAFEITAVLKREAENSMQIKAIKLQDD